MKIADLMVIANSNNDPDLSENCRLYTVNDGPKAADQANAEWLHDRDDWRAVSLAEAIEAIVATAVSNATYSDE